MQHTVVMPYSRPQHYKTLCEGMEGQGVAWAPLYDSNECRKLFEEQSAKDDAWIKPWYGDLPRGKPPNPGDEMVGIGQTYDPRGQPTVNPGHWMCDAFLDDQLKKDMDSGHGFRREADCFYRPDHYVSFMTDDCLWNWNYWRKLQKHFVKRNKGGNEYSPAVIISAHMLGGNIIYPCHRTAHQHFHESTCRTFCTRFEALTVRADKLRDVRFGSFWAGDGIVVERLVEENFENSGVDFAPECVVYFNGLRPECWGFPASHMP